MQVDESLIEFATEQQAKAIRAYIEHGSYAKAAAELGINQASFGNLIKRAKRKMPGNLPKPTQEEKKREKELESRITELEQRLHKLRGSGFRLPVGKKTNLDGKPFCRVCIPDTHGCLVDKDAIAAFLSDLEVIKPAEIVMLGDHLECGGFLAQHHTLGYVAQTEYTFDEDVMATNQLLDSIQTICPNATIDYLEGNHERRIENWCVTEALRNTRDAEYLRRMFSASSVLGLEQRGIRWIRQGQYYDGLPIPATIKRGCCYFTHGSSTAKHAASEHVKKFGGNVVYGHCFSGDTEVLTSSGWKLYDDLVVGSEVGTISLKNGEFEWQQTTDLFKHSHYKELVHIKTPTVDAMVTHDHAMVLTSRGASSMSDGIAQRNLRRVPAKELLDKSAFTIPLSGLNSNPDYDISDDMLRFCAWVITEGNISDQGQGGHIRIAQSDNDKKGGMKALDALLERLNVSHSKIKRYEKQTVGDGQYRNYDAYQYTVSRKNPICDEFKRLCPGKTLQPWMQKLSSRQWEILLETLILTDGSKHGAAQNSYQYATNKKIEADLIQSLCAMNGCRSSCISRTQNSAHYYCITINTRGLAHVTDSKPTVVPYEGRVWCCSVPNQTLVMRRNGKVFVAGNTHRADSYVIRTIGAGVIGAWSPGCLCILQPLWQHTNPTDWSHGYGLQLVSDDGSFLHINVPVINGKSYLGPLFKAVA
jgi:transposase-like protein